jgi:hypothetical protein
MKTKEILEKLEELKMVAPNPQSVIALQIAINTVRNNDSFLSWLMNLDSNKFDNKEKLLNKIQLKLLLGEKGE